MEHELALIAIWGAGNLAAIPWLYSAASGWPTVKRLSNGKPQAWVLGAFALDLAKVETEERLEIQRWKSRFWRWWLFCLVGPLVLLWGYLRYMLSSAV